jgi:predicted regulator of Ras-like GTPase activity (Roadblock/LC7/MglB family)
MAQVVEDALLAEMRALQQRVPGITGTAVASRDGLIVREDTGGVNPDNLAAIAAAWLALSQRMSSEVGQGTLREAMTRGTGGSVTIFAIGARAVLVLIGDEGLDQTRLHRESQGTLDNIRTLISDNTPPHARTRLAPASTAVTPGRPLAVRERDGVQSQANPGPDHRPVDPDELQVAAEQQLQLQ